MKTKSEILNKEFDFKAVHIGLFVDDNLWQHDKWSVIINGQTFDYKTGIGHREERSPFYKNEFKRVMQLRPKQTKENLLIHNDVLSKCSKPKLLKIDDVLYSLLIDSDVINYTFCDWCDMFGYSSDSIKARTIYDDCQKNYKKVSQFIDNLEDAQELFQDY